MKAAEKIPKKLYVYLDTTRGLHHRHGGEDVRRRGSCHRLRYARERRIRRDPDAGIERGRGDERSLLPLFSFATLPARSFQYLRQLRAQGGHALG